MYNYRGLYYNLNASNYTEFRKVKHLKMHGYDVSYNCLSLFNTFPELVTFEFRSLHLLNDDDWSQYVTTAETNPKLKRFKLRVPYIPNSSLDYLMDCIPDHMDNIHLELIKTSLLPFIYYSGEQLMSKVKTRLGSAKTVHLSFSGFLVDRMFEPPPWEHTRLNYVVDATFDRIWDFVGSLRCNRQEKDYFYSMKLIFSTGLSNYLINELIMDKKQLQLKCHMPCFKLDSDTTTTNWMEYFDTKHTKGLSMINALELNLAGYHFSREHIASTLTNALQYVLGRCQKLKYLNITLSQHAFLRFTPYKTCDYFNDQSDDLEEDQVVLPTVENIKRIVFKSVPFLSVVASLKLPEIETLKLFDCSFELDKWGNCLIDLRGLKYVQHFWLCVQRLIKIPTMEHLVIKIEMTEKDVVCYKWKVTKNSTEKQELIREAAFNTAKLMESKSTTVMTIRCPRLDQLTVIKAYEKTTGIYASENVYPSADIDEK
jgi:hypothetical protein